MRPPSGGRGFLRGKILEYHLDVDWQPLPSGGFKGVGGWKLTSSDAASDDSRKMVMRGATRDDFQSATGLPLLNELGITSNQVPIKDADGLPQSEYIEKVREIIKKHRSTLGQAFTVHLIINTKTGRLILDPPSVDPDPKTDNPTADTGAVQVKPMSGKEISKSDRLRLANAAWPELRKLVAADWSGLVPDGEQTVPVTIYSAQE
jgi:hypothetical protein